MGSHGSDKGSANITNSWHNYTTLYHSLLKGQEVHRVFELGLGTTDVSIPNNMGPNGKPGASLRGWAEYFPQARIFGADIDKRILFEEGRIKTYYCDQLDRIAIRSMWLRADLQEGFDLIVDDGLHRYDANVCFFENSIHKLQTGGLYIIEDIHNTYLGQFQDKIEVWKVNYPRLTFDLVRLPSIVNRIDNNVLVVQA
jgi:SAM-dependent methyltransferase